MTTRLTHGITLTAVRHEHVPAIAELARSRSLDVQDPRLSEEFGFLVSAYTADDYHARVDNAQFFSVALRGDEVVAYLMAYTHEQLRPDEWVNHQLAGTLGAHTVLKQVCVAMDAVRLGVASAMYAELLGRTGSTPVAAAVVTEPYNRASMLFHERIGFRRHSAMTPPDGMPRQIWLWSNSAVSAPPGGSREDHT